MKNIIYCFLLTVNFSVFAQGEIKTVCINKFTNDGKAVLDKGGKQLKECKKIKVHKKLEEKK